MTEKSIDHESSPAYTTIGEDIFMNNIMRRIGGDDTNPKQTIRGPTTANAAEQENSDLLLLQQTLLDNLLPAIHTIRVDVANSELVESIVSNFETRDHSMRKEYLGGIKLIKTAIDGSNISVDKRIRDLQSHTERRQQSICDSLVHLAKTQKELAETLSLVNRKLDRSTPLNATDGCHPPSAATLPIPNFDTSNLGSDTITSASRRQNPCVPQPVGTRGIAESRVGGSSGGSSGGAAPAKFGPQDTKTTSNTKTISNGITSGPTNTSSSLRTQSLSSTLIPEANSPPKRSNNIRQPVGTGTKPVVRAHINRGGNLNDKNPSGKRDHTKTTSNDVRPGPGGGQKSPKERKCRGLPQPKHNRGHC